MTWAEFLLERSTQRVRVLCRVCGRLVLGIREGTDIDGSPLVGIARPAQDKAAGYPREFIHLSSESDVKRHGLADGPFRCPQDGLLRVQAAEVWAAYAQARRRGKQSTVRAEKIG
jgi:hypothetical protein